MRKYILRAQMPAEEDVRKKLLESVYWYSPKDVKGMLYATVGFALIASMVLLAKMTLIVPLTAIAPLYAGAPLAVFFYRRYCNNNSYRDGFALVCLGGLFLGLFLICVGTMIAMLFLPRLSDAQKVIVIVSAYVAFALVALIALRRYMARFVALSIESGAAEPGGGRGRAYVVACTLLGGLIGKLLLGTGLVFVAVVLAAAAGFYIAGKLIVPRLAGYVNLDMLLALRKQYAPDSGDDIDAFASGRLKIDPAA